MPTFLSPRARKPSHTAEQPTWPRMPPPRRFGPHRGEYMFHCHNLVHEDFEMMRSFRVVRSPEARMNATVLALNRDATLIENLNVLYDL